MTAKAISWPSPGTHIDTAPMTIHLTENGTSGLGCSLEITQPRERVPAGPPRGFPESNYDCSSDTLLTQPSSTISSWY